jgi:hypothetical protein
LNKELAFRDVLKNLREENLAIFAGAGMSAKAGFVSWSELMKPIAEELELKIENETDYVALAQYHENEFMTRSKINQSLIDELSSNATITENHQILSRLPISTYWTTNYDRLIETALDKIGKIPDVKYTVKQLALTKSKRDAVVYKMHGDVEHPNEAIITRDDYESYYVKKEPFLSALAGDLISKTFLFIGFSFTDPNLDYILARVRTTYKKDQRRHYCFMRRVQRNDFSSKPEFEYEEKKLVLFIKDLQRFSIETILIDDFSEITDFLARLEKEINRGTVFISGAAHSYGDWDKEEAEQFIYSLSKRIINERFKVISGFGLGIGSAVVSGALEAIYQNYKTIPKDSLILRPFPQIDSPKAIWTDYRKDMINHAGIAIFMFGNKIESGDLVESDGMLEEFSIAKEKGLLIIPIGATGFVAKKIQDIIEGNICEYYQNDTKLIELVEELGQETCKYDEIINNVIEILKIVV